MTIREEIEEIRSDIKERAAEGYSKEAAILALEEFLIILDKHKGETL